jgi:hypothetical protein
MCRSSFASDGWLAKKGKTFSSMRGRSYFSTREQHWRSSATDPLVQAWSNAACLK